METKHRITGGADSVARHESEHHRAGRNACAGNDDGLAGVAHLSEVRRVVLPEVGGLLFDDLAGAGEFVPAAIWPGTS